MEIKPTCYKCGNDSSGRTLVLVHAPGTYCICNECIEKKEKETGEVAVFHPGRGLSFTSKENAEKLTGKTQ